MRTPQAGGAVLARAPQVLVRRLPPDFRHFAGQRVRQAYDSLGQPPRLAAELALLPAVAFAAGTGRYRVLAAMAGLAAGLAERGRRRHGGTAVFPWYLPLLAPAWVAERSVCSWLAVLCRLRGGVRYAGRRLPRAATPVTVLAARHRAGQATAAQPLTRAPDPQKARRRNEPAVNAHVSELIDYCRAVPFLDVYAVNGRKVCIVLNGREGLELSEEEACAVIPFITSCIETALRG
jgi:hypothetical protein